MEEIESSGANTVMIGGIDSERFLVDISGAGSMRLSGNVKKLRVDISGATSLDAEELIADHVKVDISGASSASVYAAESIDAEISGVGNLDYYGRPEDVRTDVSGVGNISRR